MSLWIKICGVTSSEAARDAVAAGADALGLVFHPFSPRAVSLEKAAAIVRDLPGTVERVGVFVDAKGDDLIRAEKAGVITAAQLHGTIDGDSLRGLQMPWYPALQPGRDGVGMILERVAEWGCARLLLDAHVEGMAGGTGRTFDWRMAAKVSVGLAMSGRASARLILAGGLTPGNVAEGIRNVRPWGVDVSTGVEASPGVKDAALVRAFIEAARSVA